MVKRVVGATEQDQREGTKADTEGVGLEASIDPDLTQTGGPKTPEERQQLQPGKKPKSVPVPMPKPKPNPNPNPKPNLAPALRPTPTPTPEPRATSSPKGAMAPVPTPTRQCETVPAPYQQEAGQPSRNPDNRLEHGIQTPNLEERGECATAE